MVTFLFWNLFRRPLLDRVVRLVKTHEVDILMLAECTIDEFELVKSLRQMVNRSFSLTESGDSKIRILSRLPKTSIIELVDDPFGGLTIRKVEIGPPPGIMLAVVHLPSRVSWKSSGQSLQMTALVRDIANREDLLGHRRTILVGDLNMNPFDTGVVGAQALHAVMTKQIARREERQVLGKAYRFFYNPMWSLLGDMSPGPPGTYYYSSSDPDTIFWNTFDQVLLRPSLMDQLVDLQILTTDGLSDLVTRHGLPKKSDCSDHLPILFRMDL